MSGKQFEEQLDGIIGQIVEALSDCDVYLREGAAKYIIRELSWAFVDNCNISQFELAEHLAGMGETIQARKDPATAEVPE